MVCYFFAYFDYYILFEYKRIVMSRCINFYCLVYALIFFTNLSIKPEFDYEDLLLDEDLLSFVDLAGEETYPLEITTIHNITTLDDDTQEESITVIRYDHQEVPQAPKDIIIVTCEESFEIPSEKYIENQEVVPVPHDLINSVKKEKAQEFLKNDKNLRKKKSSRRSSRKNARNDDDYTV